MALAAPASVWQGISRAHVPSMHDYAATAPMTACLSPTLYVSDNRLWTYAPAVMTSYRAGRSGVTHVSGGMSGTLWSHPKKKGMEYRSFVVAGRARCTVDTKMSSGLVSVQSRPYLSWSRTCPPGELVADVDEEGVGDTRRIKPYPGSARPRR